MNAAESTVLSPAILAVLRGEYLDLLMIAGRLARKEVSATDATAAAALRAWVRRQLDECRKKMELRHFSGAPAMVVEAEIAIVAFLDSAATAAFGLSVWRPLSEDLRNDYIEAGREARSVVDLGKYVYERLEKLRTRPELLQREPPVLLEIYDRCWRLGYKFSYEGRPNELEDIKAKMRDQLSQAAAERQSAQRAGPAGPLDADVALSPHLPPIPHALVKAPPLHPLAVGGLCALLLLLVAIGLSAAIYRDRLWTERTVQSFHKKVSDSYSYVDRVCPTPVEAAR
ncbi:MAG: DotU family type IV/VI secretion system protein [Myxococcales bacterium]|nr:DotU family type IV/VI secretion system protein [Myxococcales bacterium]